MERRLRRRHERRELGRGRSGDVLRRGEEGKLAGLRLGGHGGRRLQPVVLAVPVDADDEPRVAALDLDRPVSVRRQLLVGLEPVEHPADRRRRVGGLLAVDRAGDDQPLLRARHRDVVEAQLLRRLLAGARVLHGLVVERAAALRRHRVGDAEAEAAVGEREDLVRGRRRLVAARVGDDHDLELEPLRGVDGQQPHGVGSLLLRDRLELARADGLLLGDETDEALDVRPAELLVRAGEPRELAHVRVAAAAVPLREHGEVVVVLADDALAQPLEREPRQRRRQPLEPLPEREQQPLVALRQSGRQRPLEPREQRPLRRGAPQQRQPVVGHPDERRREHRQQRAVVVAVLQQPQVAEQVDHLLLAEVALAGRAVRRQSRLAQLVLVQLRVRAGGEQEHDLAGRGDAAVDELPHPPRHRARLAVPPRHARVPVRRLVGDEQLDRMPEDRIGELRRGVELLELVAEVRAEQLVHRRQHLRPRAVVQRQRQKLRRLGAPLAEDPDVRVAEAVDRLELVADEEQLGAGPAQQVDEIALEAVRVLELVDHDRAEAERLALADRLVVAEQVARGELEVLEVERRLARLRLGVRGGEAVEQLLEEVAVARGRLVERRLLHEPARLLVRRGALAARAEAGQLHQPVRTRVALEQREQLLRVAALRVGGRGIGGEEARRLAQLLHAVRQLGTAADVEPQLPSRGTERLVDAGEHPPQPGRAVRREQP